MQIFALIDYRHERNLDADTLEQGLHIVRRTWHYGEGSGRPSRAIYPRQELLPLLPERNPEQSASGLGPRPGIYDVDAQWEAEDKLDPHHGGGMDFIQRVGSCALVIAKTSPAGKLVVGSR